MKIKDIVKKVHWFGSSSLAIVMLIIFIVLFVIAFSRILDQKEVLVEEVVVPSAVEDSNKTAKIKEKEEIVPAKSDESNKSIVATEKKELEEVETYKGEESYAKVRNSLLADGWMLLERSEIAETELGKEPKDGDGKTVSCKKITITPYTTNLVEKPRVIRTRFCWKERLVSRKITTKYNELKNDAYWIEEESLTADFVHPSDKQFVNKVRHLSFYICNRSFYHCPGKPRGHLGMGNDKILTRGEANSEYLDWVIRGNERPPVDTD